MRSAVGAWNEATPGNWQRRYVESERLAVSAGTTGYRCWADTDDDKPMAEGRTASLAAAKEDADRALGLWGSE